MDGLRWAHPKGQMKEGAECVFPRAWSNAAYRLSEVSRSDARCLKGSKATTLGGWAKNDSLTLGSSGAHFKVRFFDGNIPEARLPGLVIRLGPGRGDLFLGFGDGAAFGRIGEQLEGLGECVGAGEALQQLLGESLLGLFFQRGLKVGGAVLQLNFNDGFHGLPVLVK